MNSGSTLVVSLENPLLQREGIGVFTGQHSEIAVNGKHLKQKLDRDSSEVQIKENHMRHKKTRAAQPPPQKLDATKIDLISYHILSTILESIRVKRKR